MTTRRRTVLACATVALLALLLAACGDDGGELPSHATPTASTTPATPTATPTAPTEWPTEFKIAFINLLSPLTLDANDTVAGETFKDRLDGLVAELKQFEPDIIGFNEASITSQ